MTNVVPIRLRHPDPAGFLPDLLRAIVAAETISTCDLNDAVNPRPGPGWKVDGRTRAGKAWQERFLAVFDAVIDLMDGGLIRIAVDSDGENPWEMAITDAGLHYLARTGTQDR
jgi:hypothetical protein